MRFQGIAAVFIEAETLTPFGLAGRIPVHHLRDALEALHERGYLGSQVDEQVVVPTGLNPAADVYRRARILVRKAVGDEAPIPKGPQQLVQFPRGAISRGVYEDPVAEAESLLS